MTDETTRALERLAAKRFVLSAVLTAAVLLTYFGFVLLVAYDKPLLGTILVPGLSLGILLGALVILLAWGLTGVYVLWANRHYDSALETIRRGEG